jgi:hypothetical protein
MLVCIEKLKKSLALCDSPLERGGNVTKLRIIVLHPLSTAGEERVDERSAVGVSQPGGHQRQCTSGNIASLFTHPIIASLDHPLFCKQKRGFKNILFLNLMTLPPLSKRVSHMPPALKKPFQIPVLKTPRMTGTRST